MSKITSTWLRSLGFTPSERHSRDSIIWECHTGKYIITEGTKAALFDLTNRISEWYDTSTTRGQTDLEKKLHTVVEQVSPLQQAVNTVVKKARKRVDDAYHALYILKNTPSTPNASLPTNEAIKAEQDFHDAISFYTDIKGIQDLFMDKSA